MSFKSKILDIYTKFLQSKISSISRHAIEDQKATLKYLIRESANTQFGRDHDFKNIYSAEDFARKVPIRDYEEIKPYIERIIDGRDHVLWKGKPKYFAKTSGTTSGVKYIPITRDSVPNHIQTARNALFNYLRLKKDFSVFDGKVIFLSGSPELSKTGDILTGRLSGIVNHEVPFWIKNNQLPGYETNCIEDWEKKLEKIIEETATKDMRLISGIPPWVQMYFEKLLESTGKGTIKELYPNFQILMHGGVNYEPYRKSLEKLIGGSVGEIELYPASEGFIAFQDQLVNEGMLLNTKSGIYFEFVPADKIFDENPTRIGLSDVETGKDYALILSNNAGLWGYNLGDTVQFVSLDPYRVFVSGRIKHFISAFGEHVIGKEVENAMLSAAETHQVEVIEFTVAPQVNPPGDQPPYHEWFIEFETLPDDLAAFEKAIDTNLVEQNIYYRDLIEGNILQPLKITALRNNAFRDYMKSIGKLGGQNKVPRLSNDRKIADQLQSYCLKTNAYKQ